MTHMNDLPSVARQIREQVVRMIHSAKSGHPGGSLSCAEILSVLYFDVLKIDPKNPRWQERDRFVLSKGHACPAYYTALAFRGYFPVEDLSGLRKVDHYLEGHPDVRIPGVDAPSGSLGMGLSQGLGMALGAVFSKKNYRAFVLLGDGDMQEGSTWEAIMAAGFHRVSNLVAILDSNKLQGEDLVENQMDFFPVVDKLKAFRWEVEEIDGHDFSQIKRALKVEPGQNVKPRFILAHTTKGKGVSFMENQQPWHGSVTMSDEELQNSLADILGEKYEAVV